MDSCCEPTHPNATENIPVKKEERGAVDINTGMDTMLAWCYGCVRVYIK